MSVITLKREPGNLPNISTSIRYIEEPQFNVPRCVYSLLYTYQCDLLRVCNGTVYIGFRTFVNRVVEIHFTHTNISKYIMFYKQRIYLIFLYLFRDLNFESQELKRKTLHYCKVYLYLLYINTWFKIIIISV